MPADRVVLQPLSEPACLIASSMATLEIMADRDVTESVTTTFHEAVGLGLYTPQTGNVDEAILAIMRWLGERGVAVEGGRVYGSNPYAIDTAAMVDALREGMRAFVFHYPLENGLTHAVCATAVIDDQLITADQFGFSGTKTWAVPLSFVLSKGLGAYAYALHTEKLDAPVELPEPEWTPEGVVFDHFGVWREARKANHEDYTETADFLTHLQAIGADWTNPHSAGYPRHAPLDMTRPAPQPEPPAPEPEPPHPQLVTRYGTVPLEVSDAIMIAWPSNLWLDAAELSYLESGWNPRAVNDTVSTIGPCGTPYLLRDGRRAVTEKSVGLFQINVCAHGDDPRYTEPLFNAQKGYSLYKASGWRPWTYSATALGLL